MKLLKKQTEEKETTLKAYQEKETSLVATIQEAITEIAKLQSLMADEPGAEMLALDPDDSDELMPPQLPQDADFLKSLETALQVSKETTKHYSGKRKAGADAELDWPSEERAKAAALAVREHSQARLAELQAAEAMAHNASPKPLSLPSQPSPTTTALGDGGQAQSSEEDAVLVIPG